MVLLIRLVCIHVHTHTLALTYIHTTTLVRRLLLLLLLLLMMLICFELYMFPLIPNPFPSLLLWLLLRPTLLLVKCVGFELRRALLMPLFTGTSKRSKRSVSIHVVVVVVVDDASIEWVVWLLLLLLLIWLLLLLLL